MAAAKIYGLLLGETISGTESPLESDNWAITRNAGGQNARQTQPANK